MNINNLYILNVLKDTIDALKKITHYINMGVQITNIIYLVFALIFKTGIFVTNIVLLALSIAYFIYFILTTHKFYTEEELSKRKITNLIYKILKRSITLVVVIMAVVDLCVSKTTSNYNIFLTLLMTFGLILSVILDILINVISKRFDLICSAFKVDAYNTLESYPVIKAFTGIKINNNTSPQTMYKLDSIMLKQKRQSAEKELWKKKHNIEN